MRNFIKNHTPEWWDGWCTIAVFMIIWGIGWIIVDFGNTFTTGFQVGLLFYWFGLLVHRYKIWLDEDLLQIYRDLNELNNIVIANQRHTISIKNETIAFKNETIKTQNEHIDQLKGQR